MNLFYQVFDKGKLTDGEGLEVDFKDTVILVTSNLATDLITQAGMQDEPPSVQELVKRIIDAEDKQRPLSDEAIVSVLDGEHGLKVARRTVTKYRKALGLGSSRDRRQYGDP